MKIRHVHPAESITLQMTPMIDIVFQLLVFFIFTLRIGAMEGDFHVSMNQPSTSPSQPVDFVPPMKLRLAASEDGELNAIQLNEKTFESFQALREHIISIFGGETPDDVRREAEIELDCDPQLNYRYVIDAITAISGYRSGDQVEHLIEKIRFAAPRGSP